MPSEQISPDDAALLLHKWITESTKLQAAAVCQSAGLMACVKGELKAAPDQSLFVVDGDATNPEASNIRFDPALATTLRYGDQRTVKDYPPAMHFFKKNFIAGLTLAYPNGIVIALFEVS